MRFKAEKMPSLSAFVDCELKNKLIIFPTSLIKKLLFHDISCNFLFFLILIFLIMVLVAIASFL